ncbi:MAG: chromosomal replication initiator DnaA [Alphaproteobacteria bacterium]|nr:chromosomal replication initiator DnaA [Alphaproteobacteria bacterium]MDE2043073.1 chromosomal replication initiator DnaA [Alphaproteobacteria bacterium]MDE2341151.1 chromosomal replication initiator DnaA [Alphaproteobacteria bacterium]
MTQMGLPLNWPESVDERAFSVSACNQRVVAFLNGWGRWPVAAAVLTGPRKSGRSLLGRIFTAKSGGEFIDDADRADETRLFHAWNRAQETRKPLLLVADDAPPRWRITLPDLASRLSATPSITLPEPDLALMEALLRKLVARRGLAIGNDVVHYLLRRIERSYVAVICVVDALDAAALSQRRALSVPLAREVLAGFSLTEPELENA